MEKAHKGKPRSGGSAYEAVLKIKRLYEIERRAQEERLTGAELVAFRQKHAMPLLQEFRLWLEHRVDSTPPKGLLGTAMNYALKQWPRLIVYVNDPMLGSTITSLRMLT